MIDYKYIEYLEQFVTEKRRNLFKKVFSVYFLLFFKLKLDRATFYFFYHTRKE